MCVSVSADGRRSESLMRWQRVERRDATSVSACFHPLLSHSLSLSLSFSLPLSLIFLSASRCYYLSGRRGTPSSRGLTPAALICGLTDVVMATSGSLCLNGSTTSVFASADTDDSAHFSNHSLLIFDRLQPSPVRPQSTLFIS